MGSEDPDTVISLGQLSKALTAIGEYRKALELDERCLDLYEQHFGPDHSGTLTSVHNLAVDYRDIGDHNGALAPIFADRSAA